MDIIVGSFIVGAPDETRSEIQNTLQFAHKLDIDVPSFNILGAFSGTDIWNDFVARGVLNEDQYWETSVYVPKISPHAVPFEEIRFMIYEYFRAFYLRPKQLLKEVFMNVEKLL